MLTRLSRRVAAVGKKEQDRGEALSGDDDRIDVSSTTEAQSLQKGSTPLDHATINDFLRLIIATSRGIIDDDSQKKVTGNSMNTFA
jgi:hypothetical protein